MINKKY